MDGVLKEQYKEVNMDRTFVSIGEYLSYGFTKDRVLFIDDIINKDYFSQYFWEMLLHVYSKHKHIKKINRDLTPFVDACKDSDFCKILSFLNK